MAGLVVVFFVQGEAASFSSPAVFAVEFDKPTKVCMCSEKAVLRGSEPLPLGGHVSRLVAAGKGFG